MSEIIRLIIMIGEIIGFIFFSIIFVMKCDKRRRNSDEEYTEEKLKKAKKINIIYLTINNIIIMAVFFLSCPQLVFLSYHKTIYLSIIIVASILIFLGYYMVNADLTRYAEKTIKSWIAIFMIAIGFIMMALFLPSNILVSVNSANYTLEFKTCINQEETVETIYPEFVGNTKIGHFEDSDKYIFGFKDNQGTWIIEDDLEVKPENLKSSDNTYIEKHTVTKTFKDIERHVESDDYITTEDEVIYVLFLNEGQLIEIKTD